MAKRPSNRLIRKAIREIVEPAIEALGFEGKYPRWQRKINDEYQFVEIWTAKYGGSFGISGAWGNASEFGTNAPSLPATDFDNRATLCRSIDLCTVGGKAYTHWISGFDYEHIVQDNEQCRLLAGEAKAALPALEKWFATKKYEDGVETVFSKIGSAINGELISAIASAKAQMGLY